MSVAAIIVSSRRPIAGQTCLLFVFGTSITVMDKLLGGGQPTMISALGVWRRTTSIIGQGGGNGGQIFFTVLGLEIRGYFFLM